jgi:hypothetical protein
MALWVCMPFPDIFVTKTLLHLSHCGHGSTFISPSVSSEMSCLSTLYSHTYIYFYIPSEPKNPWKCICDRMFSLN